MVAIAAVAVVLGIKSDTGADSDDELSDEKLENIFKLSAAPASGRDCESWKTAGLIDTGDSGVIGLNERITCHFRHSTKKRLRIERTRTNDHARSRRA